MRDVLRLGALLACVALAATRLGLLAHELVGHGGTALAVGAKVTDVRLFWFAGGWIRYVGAPTLGAAIAIAMGGIAVEAVVGTVLWLAVRRPNTLGRRILRGIGAALVMHAGWYLATGAFAGFGDGVLLYRELGGARVPVAIAAGAITCGAAFLGAREVLGALAATQRHRIAGTLGAIALAAGLHAGLAIGELHVRRDRTYTETMQSERERAIAQEIVRWDAANPQAQAPVRAAEAQRIEQAHPRTFPFMIVLGLATAASLLAGAWSSKPGQGGITRRLLLQWAVTALIAIAVVIAV